MFGFQEESYYVATQYYTFFEKFENYKFILNFLNSDNCKQIVKTDTIICFRGIIDFGMHKDRVKKLISMKPIFVFENSDIPDHIVYIFKWKIGGYKTKAELHFLNESFFMGVYIFENYSEKDYENIKNILFEKYHINKESLQPQSFCFVDDHNNLIFFKEFFGCSIIYFTGEKHVLQYLHEQESMMVARFKEKEIKTKNKILEYL